MGLQISDLFFTIIGMVMGSVLTLWWFGLLTGDGKKKKVTQQDDDDELAEPWISSDLEDNPTIAVNNNNQLERDNLLTGILVQLWSHISKAGCQIIREAVEPSLMQLPSPLNTMRFTALDLGTVPIRLDNVVVKEEKNGVVQIELDVVWNGECEIQLKADYVGTLGVRQIRFRGRMGFLLQPLTDTVPVTGAVQFFFIDPPSLEMDFTGLAQVADMQLIEKTVRKTIDDTMSALIVLPNRVVAKLGPATSFFDIYHPPLGFARIRLLRGQGFVIPKKRFRVRTDTPDVYCNISIGNSHVWRTSTVENSLKPAWGDHEYCDFLLFDYGQTLKVHVWDENKGPLNPDDELGQGSVTIREILSMGGTMVVHLGHRDKCTGASITIRCDMLPLASTLPDVTEPSVTPNAMSGVLTILINRAFGIPETSTATFAKVTYGQKVFQTPTICPAPGIDTRNPFYESSFHVPLTREQLLADDGGQDDLVLLEVYDATSTKPKVLAGTTVRRAALMKAPNMMITEKRSIGFGISLKFQISLQGIVAASQNGASPPPMAFATAPAPPLVSVPPVPCAPPTTASAPPTTASAPLGSSVFSAPEMASATLPTAAAPPTALALNSVPSPAGMTAIQLTAVRGSGFKIQKRLVRENDIPDVYLKINVGSSAWKTKTIPNSTEPAWNESAQFMVSPASDKIAIDAFDYDQDKLDKDDLLGRAEVTVSELLSAGGSMELELKTKKHKGKCSYITFTGSYITLRCHRVAAWETAISETNGVNSNVSSVTPSSHLKSASLGHQGYYGAIG